MTFLNTQWPSVWRAAQWMMYEGTGGTGLPLKQCCTYDIIAFDGYDHTTFNAMVYLAALKASMRIADVMSNATFKAELQTAYDKGATLLNTTLWQESKGFY